MNFLLEYFMALREVGHKTGFLDTIQWQIMITVYIKVWDYSKEITHTYGNFAQILSTFTKQSLAAYVKSNLTIKSIPFIPPIFCIETIDGHVKYHLKECN